MQKRKSFRVSKLAIAVTAALAAQSGLQLAHAGPGWGDNVDYAGKDIKVPTFYANSPSGIRKNYNPYLNGGTGTVDTGKALRKFVDTLPGLTSAGANNLGQYIPVAVADTTSYPGSDYYEIAVVEYTEKMHSDLPKGTTLRGYVQIETAANAGVSKHIPLTYPNGQPILDNQGNPVFAVDNPHYLGPTVLATKGRATRFKFSNYLPAGTVNGMATGGVAPGVAVTSREGDLFLPVDKTLLGANAGPQGHLYTQNRAEIHLHGGDTPWISDGTPHQWITPHNQAAPNPAGATPEEQLLRGVSTRNVPDMPDPGPGSVTYYFPNNQSARLMFYHDHTSGLTRLNVYAGEAAGYVLLDDVEGDLMSRGVIPGLDSMIPLVIQDRTFVPQDIAEQDARWDQNAWGKPGDLWFPHVYETNQDPNSFDGTNPVGRWDYGPWFWPVFPAPLALPTGVYGDVSTTPESFMDTPIVNGTAYPVLNVDPKAYRFRILNAANDRFLNLGLYVADGNRTTDDGRTNTEVKMVPATMAGSPLAACAVDAAGNETITRPNAPCWPSYWPTDNRREGVPDPASVGPDIVVIGNEGGFIPNPHVIPSAPIVYELNRRSVTVLNVLTSGLYLGNAERADAVIDFSAYAGKTLILYNDSPAPVPAVDPRVDYQTDNEDLSTAGGAESTKAGYGPNVRTVMQIRVANKPAAPAFDVARLQAELPAAYAKGADKPIVGQSAYNAAFGTSYVDTYAKIRTGSGQQPNFIWTPNVAGQKLIKIDVTDGGLGYVVAPQVVISGGGMVGTPPTATATIAGGRVTGVTIVNDNGATFNAMPTVTFTSDRSGGLGATASAYTDKTETKRVLPKAIHELFDANYGRMNSILAIELPFTSALIQTTVPLSYVDPATDILQSATYDIDPVTGKTRLMANGEPVELNPDSKTQIWKITHNGVDTHPVHFHLMNVQLINRIGWDGTIKPPSPSELGWKETVKMNPLEDVVIAISPKTPAVPFGVPLSTRYRDPAQHPNGTDGFTQIDFNQYLADGVTLNPSFGLTVPRGTVKNTLEDYQWEYVWHCHILGHEENDFMRPIVYKFNGERPGMPTGLAVTNEGIVTWVDDTPAADPTTKYSKKNEIGFRVERAPYDAAGVMGAHVTLATTLSNATTFTDPDAILPANAGKKFNYRVVAFNDQGTATSAGFDLTIQGAGAAAAPTNLVASVVSSSVVNLTWADNATDESGFKITRCVWATNPATNTGECVAGSSTTVATLAANVLSYSDTTAMADTQYQYQIVATNAAGPSAQALSNIVKTLPAPAIAPVGLTAVRHAVAKDTSVVLTWTDKSNNENGFLVQRSADGGQTWTDVCVAGCTPITQLPLPLPPAAANTINVSVPSATPANVNGVVTLTDTGLTQNTQYLYRVAAVTAAGAAQTMPVTIVTDYAAAPAVGAITSTPDFNKVTLSWPVAAPSTQFEIVRTGGAGAMVITTVAGNAVGAAGPNTWVDNNVVQHTAYTYTVRAINGPYRGATVSTANVTTLYAPAPAMAMVQANATTNASGAKVVALNWTPLSSSDTATGVRIMRCLETAANFNCTSPKAVFEEVYRKDVGADGIANTIGSTWTDSKVQPANGYTYRAYFVNGTVPAGAENAGLPNLAHVAVPNAFDMNAPINFTASYTQGRTYTNLAWTDNSGDLVNGVPTINETAFIVERSIDGINFSQVGTVAASAGIGAAKTYTDPTVAPGQVYTYRVKAVSVIGGSTTSSPATAAVAVDMRLGAPSNLSAAVTATTIAVTFTDNAPYQDNTGFAIKRSADGGATWTQIGTAAAVAGAGGTRTYNDATALTLVPGATYQYAVEAIWTYAGLTYRSEMSVPVSATVLPVPAPTNVTGTLTAPGYVAGTPTVTNGRIRVSFKDNALNESNFEVERSGDGGATWTSTTVIAASTANTAPTMTWDDLASVTNPLTVGTTYQYRLRAVNVTNGVTSKSADVIGSVLFAAPVAPTSASVTSPGNQTNRITWTLAAGTTTDTITIWARKQNANGTWPAYTNLATVGVTTAFRNHTGLNAGDVWQYEVRANNNLGSSAFVETATIAVAP